MDKYINLLTDFGFKKVFGEEPNKDLLISFLNTLLPAKHQIAELDYHRNEWQGVSALDRKAIFDLHCKTPEGAYFIVELQKAKQNYFKERSVYYASFPIQEQGQKGEWNFCLQAVYTIGILDFIFDDADKGDVIHTVQLKNQKNQVFYDKLTFIYITLPNFTKTLDQLSSLQDKWFFVFRHLPDLDALPTELQDSVFEKLFHITELLAFKPQERDAYQASLKYYRDLKNVIDTAYDDGLNEGMEQGMAKGMEQGMAKGIEQERAAAYQERLNTARNLKNLGLSNEQIAQVSGLSLAEIMHL
jgi:predicted transposase/invertase (TIGR01784 family)